MAGWDTLNALVREEIVQRREEGCDVDGFAERITAAGTNQAALMAVYHELIALPVRADFLYTEPSDLDAIRVERPDGPRTLTDSLSDDAWRDKFLGAWLGRCAGCALGKPLEFWPFMFGGFGNPGWKNIQRWFEGADAWPIRGYTPSHSRATDELGVDMVPGSKQRAAMALAPWSHPSERENIRFMQGDDDIRYTVLGLLMLEERGLDWDAWDIGKLWHRMLPYSYVCTAETQAYLNFAQVTSHTSGTKPHDWTTKRAWVRTYLNPYREWIGAQIRADGWAYGVASRPELAAELAWRDASFSHIKNGVYGAMFAAAMIAAAFVERDMERIVTIGLSEIPHNSRLAHDVRRAVEIAHTAPDQVTLVDRIWEAFKHYHPVHTNNNAALVAAALIFAGDNYEQAITTAVLGGWDTDCNGATVGSIMGAKLGAAALPTHWTSPLHDTLYAEVNGFHPLAISACAQRSYAVFRTLQHADQAA